MKHFLLAIPNDMSLASKLGKKGSVNGVTFYNRKSGDSTFVILAPSDLSEKFNALAEIITLSQNIIISTSNIDKIFGEALIAGALLGRTIILTDNNDVSGLLKGIEVDYKILKEHELLDFFADGTNSDGELKIEVDKSFSVKGIGTVLLGIVQSGTVKSHDSLISSNGKQLTVRSIQVQDDDVPEAGVWSRVGLAVKGVESDDIEKGEVLSRRQIKQISAITAEIKISPMAKDADLTANEIWLVSGFKTSICKVSDNNGKYKLDLRAHLALDIGDKFLLVRKEAPRIFAAGTVTAI